MSHKSLITIAVFAALLGGVMWWASTIKPNDQNVIATRGIHWHPELEIYVKGEKIEIPKNIGLAGTESPIHTHDDLPLIHLEFSGRVTKNDVRLGEFFRVWGKDFHAFGQNVTMTVNGAPNTEFENYSMKDKDKIVLRYE